MRELPALVQDFADTFVALQAEPHQADYAPKDRYSKQRAMAAIERAENAINDLDSVKQEDKQVLLDSVAHILFKQRK